MPVPVLRPVRQHPEAGRPVRAAVEHSQREDLRVPLVLVLDAGRRRRRQPGVPRRRQRGAGLPFPVVEVEFSPNFPSNGEDGGGQVSGRQLVLVVPVEQERRFRRVQRPVN